MKKTVIALKMHHGQVTADGVKTQMKLPPGCLGIMMVFESKKAAREYWGKDIGFAEIEMEKRKK